MKRFSWTGERVCQALGLSATGGGAVEFAGVSTDTRTMKTGELFVALRGERYDGSEFVAEAARAGAAGAVAERRPEGLPDAFELFIVDDALVALGKLAAARRDALDPTVVAITGTSGKTTTRELTAAALGDRAYASPGNFNNLVGTPLSILAAPEDAGVWVLEVASNSPGEIAALGHIVRPDYAVITSVSEGHLEGLGDLEGVLAEKLSLLPALRPGGRALVADEPELLGRRARELRPETLTVGLSELADERPERWSSMKTGVGWRWHGVDFELEGFGSHLISDALFACCIAHLLGVDPVDAARRLRTVKLPAMRGEVRRIDGIDLLVDCYNANPASFRAAIDALDSLAGGRRRAVLAGSMLELGERSQALHEEVACLMVSAGIEIIAGAGAFSRAFGNCSRPDLILEDRLEDAYHELAGRLDGDEAVLIKASRGMKFERAIPWFERDFGAAGREISRANS
ncbi:MAG TPA: UDP-N-acetylmuramoyl-tripeptide--D-alanyl-D-alanine ligase [Gemmatimonadota bacterium]|nr:UDP-N-acetylmuramoyl-tripeptide--D-alanyl-D-alanine ligase [Gemmatimonadota bacterium]